MKTVKYKYLALLTMLLLAACSTTNWHDISEHEIANWKSIGFDAQAAQDWKEDGFSSKQAGAWTAANFNRKEAKEWADESFNADEAKNWKQGGFDLNDAIEDRNRGLAPATK